MREIKREFQIKSGNKWHTTFEVTDPENVLGNLSHDLIAKKLNACTYIRSIKRTNNYDGTQTIVVTYENVTRNVYTIPN
jgi:hypothetical protein